MNMIYIYYLFMLIGVLFPIDSFMNDGLQKNGVNNIHFNEQSYGSVVLEDEINESLYILGPGDKLHINIVTASQVINLTLPISPTGDILIPVVGNIKLNNISLENGIKLIKKECNKKYKDSDIFISLVDIKKFKIKVLSSSTGGGIYTVSSIDRISTLYNQIINSISPVKSDTLPEINSNSFSTRNIELIRDNQVYRVDLEYFESQGENQLNPFFMPNDVIRINMIDNYVYLAGAFKVPGKYEYVKGETLSRIIELSGGLTIDSDTSRIIITRFINDIDTEQLNYKNFADAKNIILEPEDHIYINKKNNYKEHNLFEISGEVKFPGIYGLESSTSLSDAISIAGGYTKDADQNKIIINNKYIGMKNKKLINRKINLSIDSMDEIDKEIFKARNLSTEGGAIATDKYSIKNLLEQQIINGDHVIVPEKQFYIEVIGSVKFPGRYTYENNFRVSDYITKAGGTTKTASKNIYIINSLTGQRIKSTTSSQLSNGDIVFVLDKKEYDKRENTKDFMSIISQIATTLLVLFTISGMIG